MYQLNITIISIQLNLGQVAEDYSTKLRSGSLKTY